MAAVHHPGDGVQPQAGEGGEGGHQRGWAMPGVAAVHHPGDGVQPQAGESGEGRGGEVKRGGGNGGMELRGREGGGGGASGKMQRWAIIK